jgi:hypothetical protein
MHKKGSKGIMAHKGFTISAMSVLWVVFHNLEAWERFLKEEELHLMELHLRENGSISKGGTLGQVA